MLLFSMLCANGSGDLETLLRARVFEVPGIIILYSFIHSNLARREDNQHPGSVGRPRGWEGAHRGDPGVRRG